MTQFRLNDLVEGAITVDMPDAVKEALKDIHKISLDFPDSVIDLRISTYNPEPDRYRLYFVWETSKWGSSKVAYIAYDKQRKDFFDWYIAMTKDPPRYNHEQLLEHFQKEFPKQNRNL